MEQESWHLDKRVPIALIFAMVVQFGGLVGGGGRGAYYNLEITQTPRYSISRGNSGGGTGIYGQGSNGVGGTSDSGGTYTSLSDRNASFGNGGTGGSGGEDGSTGSARSNGNGGLFGGGGGNGGEEQIGSFILGKESAGNGAGGAVRIIWPGDERSFPSTRTLDE